MTADIRREIAGIIAEQAMIEADAITDETTMEELGLDSLALVEVVFGIEERFDISIPYNANDPSVSDFNMTNFAAVVEGVAALVAPKDET